MCRCSSSVAALARPTDEIKEGYSLFAIVVDVRFLSGWEGEGKRWAENNYRSGISETIVGREPVVNEKSLPGHVLELFVRYSLGAGMICFFVPMSQCPLFDFLAWGGSRVNQLFGSWNSSPTCLARVASSTPIEAGTYFSTCYVVRVHTEGQKGGFWCFSPGLGVVLSGTSTVRRYIGTALWRLALWRTLPPSGQLSPLLSPLRASSALKILNGQGATRIG